MTTTDLLKKVLQVLPNATISEDADGQVVINTGLHQVAGTDDLFGHDPATELFIVSQLSRQSIADQFNANLDREEFTADDARLTSELCDLYAYEYGDTYCDGDEERQMLALDEMTAGFLKEHFGLVLSEA